MPHKDKQKRNEYSRGWAKNHPESRRLSRKKWGDKHPNYYKEWRGRNKEYLKNFEKERNKDEKRIESRRIRQQRYREQNREHVNNYWNEWRKQKKQKSPKFHLDGNMATMVWKVLLGQKLNRKWQELVGYTSQELMEHLENLFDEKMNWDNYGSYWAVDHINPKSLFKYEKPEDEEFKKCWALENLQPLEKIANLEKYNKVFEPMSPKDEPNFD